MNAAITALCWLVFCLVHGFVLWLTVNQLNHSWVESFSYLDALSLMLFLLLTGIYFAIGFEIVSRQKLELPELEEDADESLEF